jgi:hypothetical protein
VSDRTTTADAGLNLDPIRDKAIRLFRYAPWRGPGEWYRTVPFFVGVCSSLPSSSAIRRPRRKAGV